MSGMKKVYDDLIVINLYLFSNMIVEGVGSQVISEIVFMKNKKTNRESEKNFLDPNMLPFKAN